MADVLDEAVIERVLDCRPSRASPEEVLVKHKGSKRMSHMSLRIMREGVCE